MSAENFARRDPQEAWELGDDLQFQDYLSEQDCDDPTELEAEYTPFNDPMFDIYGDDQPEWM